MSQFNFGSNLGAGNANTSGFGFAAPNKTATPAFGTLGAAQTQTQPSGSITFGTPIASVAPTVQNQGLSFGSTPTVQNQGLSFGSTPTLGTGLNFGAPASAASTTGLNFATAAKAPTFGTATTQSTLNFGATTPTAQNLSFGAPANSTPAPTTGLSFRAPVSTVSTGLSFGTPASTAGLNFAAPAASTGFALGGTTTTTAANPLGGGLSFGTPTSTTLGGGGGLNFGSPASSNPNPLGGINFSTPASTTGFTLGLGTNTSTTSGLNFGAGLGGTSTAGGLSFKGFAPTTTSVAPAATAIGLGGVDSSQLKTGTTTTGSKDTVAAKENNVPNEILQSIENFKQFVKDQKSQSSDVSRGSTRPFAKVKEDIDLINNVLSDVGNDLQRNQQQADKLKHDSAKCLHNADMAQRTNDTPPGLQFENTAPLKYFIELVNQFEQDLQALRVQIDVTDKHFQSLHEPKFLTSQELAVGMRRLHDTFVALAGRLHSVHTQVESQKEQYLNLRKYILKDPTNIFVKPPSKEEQALDVALKGLAANKSVYGPTPFSSFGSPFAMNLLAQQAAKPPPAYPATTAPLSGYGTNCTGILGMGTSQLGASTTLFGNTSSIDSGFQLQNPPPGNKRGKRDLCF